MRNLKVPYIFHAITGYDDAVVVFQIAHIIRFLGYNPIETTFFLRTEGEFIIRNITLTNHFASPMEVNALDLPRELIGVLSVWM